MYCLSDCLAIRSLTAISNRPKLSRLFSSYKGDCVAGIEECLTVDPPVCSQLCVGSQRRGGYRCSCVDGYQLAPDHRQCLVASRRWKTWKSSSALLFYTQSGRVIRRSVRPGGTSKLVYRATGLVSALGRLRDLILTWYDAYVFPFSRK